MNRKKRRKLGRHEKNRRRTALRGTQNKTGGHGNLINYNVINVRVQCAVDEIYHNITIRGGGDKGTEGVTKGRRG